MGWYKIDGSWVHLSVAKTPRVVPGPERHKWNRPYKWGEVTTCLKCGVKRCHRKSGEVVYRKAGSKEILIERPACTGSNNLNQ